MRIAILAALAIGCSSATVSPRVDASRTEDALAAVPGIDAQAATANTPDASASVADALPVAVDTTTEPDAGTFDAFPDVDTLTVADAGVDALFAADTGILVNGVIEPWPCNPFSSKSCPTGQSCGYGDLGVACYPVGTASGKCSKTTDCMATLSCLPSLKNYPDTSVCSTLCDLSPNGYHCGDGNATCVQIDPNVPNLGVCKT